MWVTFFVHGLSYVLSLFSLSMGKMTNPCLEPVSLDDPNIGRNVVAGLDLDDVTQGEVFGPHRYLLSVPDADGVLRQHVLERLHDLIRLPLWGNKNGEPSVIGGATGPG